MRLYLDTSALLKIFLTEEGSPVVIDLAGAAESVATSRVGYTEARSGLARARRNERIDSAVYADILSQFEDFWRNVMPVDVTEPVVRLAGDFAELHALRGFDAIHLASAVTLQRALDEPVHFAAADDRLVAAAVASGLLNTGA
ncbi:MAG: type II toxin-antitoxin system VapC family toxin [Dehalococcoidia bacterium]